ncbi:MAG: transposase [Candidatus Omnitrophica bacterium]|nr:transposase [Candidatus Omnitrophota bacterium]
MKKIFQVLKVSKSGCYNWENKEPSNRFKGNTIMLNRIKVIYAENSGRYGSIRITKQLKKDGIICGKNRIANLMRKNFIRTKTKKNLKLQQILNIII